MKIAVIGMGKIGLPLAVQFALKGNIVIGVDINQTRVEQIRDGVEPFPGEHNLKDYLRKVLGNESFTATLDYKKSLNNANVVVVTVPLIINENLDPDFSSIDKSTYEIAKCLQKGTLVCFETTVPIGTTRNRIVPILEEVTGMKAGKDFYVAFSPERVTAGRIFEDLRKYPKIVGGFSQLCGDKAVDFYTKVLDFDERNDLSKPNGVWKVSNLDCAEFVKLAETTYRDVNIALANQFAKDADKIGVNINEVITSSNSQHYSHIHAPGISVGGHCIPVYPYLYLHNNPENKLIKLAREINESIPRYIINQIEFELGSLRGTNILTLGISFRPKVKEHSFSGVFELNKLIQEKGGNMQVVDPYYSKYEINSLGLNCYDGIDDKIDVIILHTAHKEFYRFLDQDFQNCKLILDGRDFIKPTCKNFSKVKKYGDLKITNSVSNKLHA